MISLGLDVALAHTGVLGLSGDRSAASLRVIHNQIVKAPERGSLIVRALSAIEEIMAAVDKVQPDLIVIEAYGWNAKHPSSVIPLITIGAILRATLNVTGKTWLEPTPSQLKQFASGQGNMKEMIPAHVQKNWGHMATSTDEADAYVCAAIGLAFKGQLPKPTAKQLEVISGLAVCN